MKGIGAVGGMAMARVFLINEEKSENIKGFVDDSEKEYERLLAAKEVTALQLEAVMKAVSEKFGSENGEIFDYQLLLLDDEEFLGEVKRYILEEHYLSEYALSIVSQNYINILANIDNDYLKERTADVADLTKRLNAALSGRQVQSLDNINDESIITAVDLTPSQTAGINKNKVKGIVLERGGKSSHSVIIARSMGIPCVVGVADLIKNVSNGELVIMNGNTGEIITSPEYQDVLEFENYKAKELKEKEQLNQYIHSESKTKDGFEVKVFANITSECEIRDLIDNGGEGVGLFRTEFIYMKSSAPPSEETQFKIYSQIARELGERPLIIRTLDAGGDKEIGYLKIPKEENPFLGFRAIRYCLENPEIFKTQVAAILRAGQYGNVEFMLPMIASIEELRTAKAIIEDVKRELSDKGVKFSNSIKLGMMMETPAAALMVDKFAREVDFFSIGTNDLTQYLFAADRMNEKVSYLNSYFHPALLQTVKNICCSAKKQGIKVDICGQAGENVLLIPLWVAMGVDNLSVSIPSIPKVRKMIKSINRSEASKILNEVLKLDTSFEVQSYLTSQFR